MHGSRARRERARRSHACFAAAPSRDTDGDGVLDGADAFPLDATKSQSNPVPGDTTPPTITLVQPATAVPIP